MQHNDITDDLAKLAFDFFYLFSRFEFALKECGYLESKKPGAKAKPNWNGFVEEWEDRYSLSEAGRALLEANPATQVIARNGIHRVLRDGNGRRAHVGAQRLYP